MEVQNGKVYRKLLKMYIKLINPINIYVHIRMYVQLHDRAIHVKLYIYILSVMYFAV